MTTGADIETQVIEVIRGHLHFASERRIDRRARLMDDLGADSLAMVELTLVFEEAFDIDIADEDADNIQTVSDAIVAVQKMLQSQHRA